MCVELKYDYQPRNCYVEVSSYLQKGFKRYESPARIRGEFSEGVQLGKHRVLPMFEGKGGYLDTACARRELDFCVIRFLSYVCRPSSVGEGPQDEWECSPHTRASLTRSPSGCRCWGAHDDNPAWRAFKQGGSYRTGPLAQVSCGKRGAADGVGPPPSKGKGASGRCPLPSLSVIARVSHAWCA